MLKTIDDIHALSQPNPSREAIGARAVHIANKMSDLPHAYRNLLPTTDDRKALQEAEAAIRSIHAADREAHASLNEPPQVVAKMSSRQLLELGLQQGKPGGVQGPQSPPTDFGRSGLGDSAAQAAISEPPQGVSQSATKNKFSSISSRRLIELGLRHGEPGDPQSPLTDPVRSGLGDSAPRLSPVQLLEQGLRGGGA
jgi:hypothetical protein